jgi:mycoredoxin
MALTVYSAPWCHHCREAKRWLAEHDIAYTDVDIETVPGAADEVLKHTGGKRAIPQFVLDGKWIQPYTPSEGFLYDEMERLFGITE